MNTGNLVFLTLVFSLAVLSLQRTLSNRRWLTLVLVVLPVGYFSYRWAIYREQWAEFQYAVGTAIVFNVLFWLAYGRTHPPGHKGDITVLGMEDLD